MSEVYRDDNCLEHMIEASRKIRRIAAVSRADYDSSEEKQLALERLFEIIGEAASKVSDDFKKAHPQIRRAAQVPSARPLGLFARSWIRYAGRGNAGLVFASDDYAV